MTQIHRGGCLCGAVRFTTSGRLRGVVYCHCTQCRRQTGHFVAATSAPDAALSVEGNGNLAWYGASAHAKRGFCRTCGSLLFWKQEGTDTTSIMAGAFDRPSGLAGDSHIFVADKGDYYEINDGLPQFADYETPVAVARG
ncbi:MAG: GFA family protein [Mesorhizobium sp.]|nr:GFA family protein [Mesorhizobium sp.]MBN9242729.1 GFA family protein [Mesorhizobium sp.]